MGRSHGGSEAHKRAVRRIRGVEWRPAACPLRAADIRGHRKPEAKASSWCWDGHLVVLGHHHRPPGGQPAAVGPIRWPGGGTATCASLLVCEAPRVDLDDLLVVMDRAAANLAKLDAVWARAQPFIPTGPQRGSSQEYDDLRRTWSDLLVGFPPIDGWTITSELPDIDELGQAYLDLWEISEPSFEVDEAGARPGKDLAEYRFRLNRARRRAVRERLQELTATVDMTLPRLLVGIARDSTDRLESAETAAITAAIEEIERLIGDSVVRRGRWSDLHRHLYFGQGHDWHDINEFDWLSVKPDIKAAGFSDTDPLPVPAIDLGEAAARHPTGAATTALAWQKLDDDGFERLLYDLLRSFPEHQNVQWLTKTRAPDRGRDLSMERVLRDSTGGVRTERVIVQAKHWLSRSVGHTDLAETVASVSLWEPPVVRVLIMVTSGRFTIDAIAWTDKHNDTGVRPFIELWPESRLETLLAQKPHLAAAHHLR